ncbi:hypothetical protein Vretimale_18984 [Volvox reticuliferus]|uniref:Condensin complex subunit 2 n=1 Tax=Volvox reticuliferus TaxID=1737510 RepID=A0A8J4FZ77_9CHLO|nr:hypothetical protein Vretifemale_20084 [Volvox reticuliferus]GIM16350.1 hypothetical protein Vretimale_18984 [Volvox reticuliferus]
MGGMEVDDMELDADDMEVDQGRRKRAAQKLVNRLGVAEGADDKAMTEAQARDILRQATELSCGNKISVNNAFNLHGIDALRTLVFSSRARDSARSNEGQFFQSAGFGLEAGTKIYCKRVDAVYNLANSINYGQAAPTADDDDGDGQDQDGQGGTQGGGGEDGDAYAVKSKKRQSAASAEATLVEDSELKQRIKEPTFDADPFFVRTSRLIDENSPQGLLLHNLPVLISSDIAFDSNIRPQALLEQARENASVTRPANDVMVDVTQLPSVRGCLAAAASAIASISPGIERLCALLQPRQDCPGLKVAGDMDPEQLLGRAWAANEGARAEEIRRATERHAVMQAENMMDFDLDEAAGVSHNHSSCQGIETEVRSQQPDWDDDDGGVDDGAAEGTSYGGYGSDGDGHGLDAGDDNANDDVPDGSGGSQRDGVDNDFNDPRVAGLYGSREDGDDQGGSGDESVLLSLLDRAANSQAGSSAAMQSSWWKSRARKAAAAAAGTKPRARKPKSEPEPLDWRASPQPQLEAVQLHTYKTARRDASAKLCLPQEEPSRLDALHCYFSAAPAVANLDLRVRVCGASVLARAGAWAPTCTVKETWRILLLADYQRERQLRRGAARKSIGSGLAANAMNGGPRLDVPSASGTDGPYRAPDGGEECNTAWQHDDSNGLDDAGHSDAGADGDYYDDNDDDTAGAGSGDGSPVVPYSTQDIRGPTLEDLLQPPRRVRRLAIKYDKTAGVADVATLKAKIEVSLREVAASSAPKRRLSAPLDPSPLSFQAVLDQVSAHAFGKVRDGSILAAPGKSPGSFLTGVSTHLAFICLLHLANEKGLALRNSDQLDALIITGLGDLAPSR